MKNPNAPAPVIMTDEFIVRSNVVQLVRTKKQNSFIFSKQILTLIPSTPAQVLAHRQSGKPGLVFKHGSFLYYTPLKTKIKFLSTTNLGSHLCSECDRMSSLPNSLGGCRKVRNISLSGVDLSGDSNYKQRIANSKRIEKYEFVNIGYESFNTSHDVFVVLKCKNHKVFAARPNISNERANILKRSLEDFLHDGHTF